MNRIIILGKHSDSEELPEIFCFTMPDGISPEDVTDAFRSRLFEAGYTHRIDPVAYAAECVCEKLNGWIQFDRMERLFLMRAFNELVAEKQKGDSKV